jgi:hypothetical protein
MIDIDCEFVAIYKAYLCIIATFSRILYRYTFTSISCLILYIRECDDEKLYIRILQ